jgi:hypothetical protein
MPLLWDPKPFRLDWLARRVRNAEGTAMGLTRRRVYAARRRRNRRQEGLTAEYSKYAENRTPPGSLSVYSAYSAVYVFPEESSPPANNLDYWSAPVRGPQFNPFRIAFVFQSV